MDMTGSQRIEAPRAVVWGALNDPDVLKACIPGCEAMEKMSDTEMNARVTLKLGPVKASFTGQVVLSDIDPPNGYTITGEGNGGIAGQARGGAKVRLEDEGENATMLHYEVQSEIAGKIAQLGSRLIDSSAKKLAADFFENFSNVLNPKEPEAQAEQKKGWLAWAKW